MRSELCEFLDQMQHVADADNIIVQARHFDILDFYFKCKKTPEQAVKDYRDNFLPRWNAITDNGKNTETDEVRPTATHYSIVGELWRSKYTQDEWDEMNRVKNVSTAESDCIKDGVHMCATSCDQLPNCRLEREYSKIRQKL